MTHGSGHGPERCDGERILEDEEVVAVEEEEFARARNPAPPDEPDLAVERDRVLVEDHRCNHGGNRIVSSPRWCHLKRKRSHFASAQLAESSRTLYHDVVSEMQYRQGREMGRTRTRG